LATLHSSKAKDVSGFRESNERLEYLGDAILGAAVAITFLKNTRSRRRLSYRNPFPDCEPRIAQQHCP